MDAGVLGGEWEESGRREGSPQRSSGCGGCGASTDSRCNLRPTLGVAALGGM